MWTPQWRLGHQTRRSIPNAYGYFFGSNKHYWGSRRQQQLFPTNNGSFSTTTPNPDVNPMLLRRLFRIVMRQCKCYDSKIVNLFPPISIRHEGMSLHEVTTKEAAIEDIVAYVRLHQLEQPASDPPVMVVGFEMEEEEGEESAKHVVFRVADKSAVAPKPIPFKPMVWCHTDVLQDAIRAAFRGECADLTTNDAIAAFGLLSHQQLLQKRTYSYLHAPQMIRVTAVAHVVRHYQQKYRYGYRIRVENMDQTEYKLMGRTWHIRPDCETQEIITVPAENGGVVGEFPVLKPKHVFEYQSAAEASKNGSMEGFFHFRTMNGGETFAVPVGPFLLEGDESV